MSKLVIVAAMSSLLFNAMAMWEPIGPYSGDVHAIAQSPSNPTMMFAALETGGSAFFVSNSGGNDWVRHTDIGHFTSDIYCGAGNVLLASGNGFIVRSTDLGDTWVEVYSANTRVNQIVMHPTNSQTVFATGTSSNDRAVFFQSADNGQSWQSTIITSLESDGSSLAVSHQNPNKIYIGGFLGDYQNQTPALFVSQNNGATFTPANCDGIPSDQDEFISISVNPDNESILIATTDDYVLRSTDEGDNWSIRASDLNWAEKVAYSTVNSNYAFAVESEYIHISTDAGISWTKKAAGSSGNHCKEVLPSLTNGTSVYIGNSMGLHSSTDTGSSWQLKVNGINGGEGTAVAVAPSNPSIVWAQLEDHGLFKSTDGGDSWTKSGPWPFTCNDFSSIAIHPSNPNILFTFEGNG